MFKVLLQKSFCLQRLFISSFLASDSYEAKMAATRAVAAIVTVAALLHVAIATRYTVGGPNGGWNTITDLQAWASTKRFTPGDSLSKFATNNMARLAFCIRRYPIWWSQLIRSLCNKVSFVSAVFTYTSSHDVLEVTKAAYDACSATTPVESYTGGNTAIKLSAPGKRYFICGVPGHCAAGMKLDVDIISTAVGAPPPKHHYPPAAPMSTSHSPSEPPMVAPSRAPSASFPPMSHAPGVAPSMQSAARCCKQCANLAVGLAMGVLLILAVWGKSWPVKSCLWAPIFTFHFISLCKWGRPLLQVCLLRCSGDLIPWV